MKAEFCVDAARVRRLIGERRPKTLVEDALQGVGRAERRVAHQELHRMQVAVIDACRDHDAEQLSVRLTRGKLNLISRVLAHRLKADRARRLGIEPYAENDREANASAVGDWLAVAAKPGARALEELIVERYGGAAGAPMRYKSMPDPMVRYLERWGIDPSEPEALWLLWREPEADRRALADLISLTVALAPPRGEVLDVSAGTGIAIEQLFKSQSAQRGEALKFQANEPSPAMSRRMKQHLAELDDLAIRYGRCVLPSKGLGRARFDVVVLSRTLNLLAHPSPKTHHDQEWFQDAALSAATDALRPGGHLVFIDESPAPVWPYSAYTSARDVVGGALFHGRLRPVPVSQVRESLDASLAFVAHARAAICSGRELYLLLHRKRDGSGGAAHDSPSVQLGEALARADACFLSSLGRAGRQPNGAALSWPPSRAQRVRIAVGPFDAPKRGWPPDLVARLVRRVPAGGALVIFQRWSRALTYGELGDAMSERTLRSAIGDARITAAVADGAAWSGYLLRRSQDL